MSVQDDVDGSYTLMAAGDETRGDENLHVEFHMQAEYDKVASEGTWIPNPDSQLLPPIFKKGSLTQPYNRKMGSVEETYARSKVKTDRPVFVTKEYVRIAVPGDRFSVIDKEADDIYRDRFPKQYEQFKSGGNQQHGTPLSTLVAIGLLEQATVAELTYNYISTVEQLCGVADDKAPILGFKDLQAKARAFMRTVKEPMAGDDAARLRENDLARIASLEKQLESMKQGKGKAA